MCSPSRMRSVARPGSAKRRRRSSSAGPSVSVGARWRTMSLRRYERSRSVTTTVRTSCAGHLSADDDLRGGAFECCWPDLLPQSSFDGRRTAGGLWLRPVLFRRGSSRVPRAFSRTGSVVDCLLGPDGSGRLEFLCLSQSRSRSRSRSFSEMVRADCDQRGPLNISPGPSASSREVRSVR